MSRKQIVTAAIRALRTAAVPFSQHLYDYQPGGGAAAGAEQLGVDVHRVIKTLILETNEGDAVCVLMHGDRSVSLKALARHLEVKAVAMADPKGAQRTTGYMVGGTSPFGLRTQIPTYYERSIDQFESILINGGKRGLLVEVPFAAVVDVLDATPVDVAI